MHPLKLIPTYSYSPKLLSHSPLPNQNNPLHAPTHPDTPKIIPHTLSAICSYPKQRLLTPKIQNNPHSLKIIPSYAPYNTSNNPHLLKLLFDDEVTQGRCIIKINCSFHGYWIGCHMCRVCQRGLLPRVPNCQSAKRVQIFFRANKRAKVCQLFNMVCQDAKEKPIFQLVLPKCVPIFQLLFKRIFLTSNFSIILNIRKFQEYFKNISGNISFSSVSR